MAPDLEGGSRGRRWLYIGMASFLLGSGLVADAVFSDKLNRHHLETVSQQTAVGDPVTLLFDPKQNPAKELLRWKGEAYFLQTNQQVSVPDSSAIKLAVDDSGKIQLYQTHGQKEKRLVLVKLGRDRFLVLTPR